MLVRGRMRGLPGLSRLLGQLDGLLEACDQQGELFGEQRLLELLDANRQPPALFEEIQRALVAFRGEQQDDAGALCDLARPKAHSKRLNTAGTVTLNIDEVLCVGGNEGQQSKAKR